MRYVAAPYPGKCLCGAVQFRVAEEPLTLYAMGELIALWRMSP